MANTPGKTPDGISESFGWLHDAPGGDTLLDDLFPPTDGTVGAGNPPASATAPEGTPSSNPAAPAVQPQAPAPAPAQDQFFLHAPTGTVYKTREEAEQGFAQKDTLIENLRKQLIDITHTDPITGKIIPSAQQQPAEVNYAMDSAKLWDDATEAVTKGDKARYGQVMTKLINDVIAPYAPVLVDSARVRAQSVVSQELPDFTEVVRSPAHEQILNKLPGLRDAIKQAEANPAYYGQLPELYQIEYYVTQALRKAEATAQPAAAPSTPPTARPTVAPATLTPPSPAARLDLSTSEGRKAIIEQGKQRGLDNLLFGDLKV